MSSHFTFAAGVHPLTGNASSDVVATIVEDTIAALYSAGLGVSHVTFDACAVNISAARALAMAAKVDSINPSVVTLAELRHIADTATNLAPKTDKGCLSMRNIYEEGREIFFVPCANHVGKVPSPTTRTHAHTAVCFLMFDTERTPFSL